MSPSARASFDELRALIADLPGPDDGGRRGLPRPRGAI